MKHRVITYSESYEFKEYGMGRWRKIGLETEIEEGECPMNVHLKQFEEVSAIKDRTIADIESRMGTKTIVVDESPVDQTIKGIIEDINGCTAIDEKNGFGVQTGLIAYSQLAAEYPEVKAAYDLQMIKLTKK